MTRKFDWRTFDGTPEEGEPILAARQLDDYEWGFDLIRLVGDYYFMRDYRVDNFDYTYWTYIEPPIASFPFRPYIVKSDPQQK